VRIARIDPINDLVWAKDPFAIETTTTMATFNFSTVVAALPVGNTQQMVFG